MSYAEIPESDLDANSGIIESTTLPITRNLVDHETRIQDLEDFAGGEFGNTRMIQSLLNDTTLTNAAYTTGVEVTTNATIEGLLEGPVDSTSFKLHGLVQIDTDMMFPVITVNTNTSVVVTDAANRTAELTSGTVFYVIKTDTINGATAYAVNGLVTSTGSSSSATFQTTIPMTSTSGVSVGNYLIKKGLVTLDRSCVALGSSNSFSAMTEKSILKFVSVANGGGSGLTHYWNLGTSATGSEAILSGLTGPNLTIAGTLSIASAGITTSTASSSSSWGSNRLYDSTHGAVGSGSVLAANWRQSWSLCFWIYRNTTFTDGMELVGDVSDGRGFRLYVTDSGNAVRINDSTSNSTNSIPIASVVSGWNFITITHRIATNSRWTVMLNGVQTNINDELFSQQVNNPSNSGGTLHFGANAGGSGAIAANTRYDEAYIFNRQITIAEHQALYNSGTGQTPLGIRAVLLQRFSDSSFASGTKIAAKVTTVKAGSPLISVNKYGIIKG